LRAIAARWVSFLAIIGSFAALDQWANYWVNHRFATVTAEVAAWLLRLLGAGGQAVGTRLNSIYCNFEIIGECTAYYPSAIFCAATLSYPCSWRWKLAGIGFGLPALLMINQGRLVSLCYTYSWYPTQFEIVHVLVWQSLIIFFAVLLWVIWVAILARDPGARAA
jgi:archaeosortase B (VPXXXP-CTERM-specific)